MTILLSFDLIAQKVNFDYFGLTPPGNIPIKFASEIISKDGGKAAFFMYSPDGTEATVCLVEAKQTAYLMTKENGNWSPPKPAYFIDDDSLVNYPTFSPDGKYFWFTGGNNARHGWGDLYVSEKNGQIWGKPIHLPYPVNSERREGGFSLTMNNTLYFTSGRDDKHNCCSDVYRSRFINGKYSVVERMNNLSTDADEESLFISPDENYIIVQSWRQEGIGMHDFYIAYRDENDSWTPLILMDTVINTKDLEVMPVVSPDGKYFFFSRVNVAKRDIDIYWVSTKKIFKPYVYHTIPDTSIRVNQFFNFSIPSNTFKDYDSNQLTLSASMINGEKLPGWLIFDAKNYVFKGVPTKSDTLIIKVTAADENSNYCSDKFKLIVDSN
jgi:hypothetical protein